MKPIRPPLEAGGRLLTPLVKRGRSAFSELLSEPSGHRGAASPWADPTPIRDELFSVERLEDHARTLAAAHVVAARPLARYALARRLGDDAKSLQRSYQALSRAADAREAISPAAEWLIDNYHVVERQIREVRMDLPPGYYRRLPKLSGGRLSGYPRVLGLAWAYVAHTDSHFAPDVLCRFLRAYQDVTPLTIGELWAVPITLRVVLIENLRRFGQAILRARDARLAADRLAERLLDAAHRDERASVASHEFEGAEPAFIVHFAQRLRDQAYDVTPALKRLDATLTSKGTTIDAIVQEEQQREINATISVRNIITSMRLVQDVDWTELFERVSLVEDALRESAVYASMDFPTRDLYRRAIEELARGARRSEPAIARSAVRAAAQANPPKSAAEARFGDPGYYLIADGRASFENAIGYRAPLEALPIRFVRALGIGGYVATGAAVSLGLLSVPLTLLSEFGVNWTMLCALGALGALPAIEAAVALVNHFVTRGVRATLLPGLEMAEGVPPALRTIVVVPCLLTSKEAIEELVEHLEVHYISSPKGEVYFALLSDWKDAPAEHADGDQDLLQAAAQGIARLNRVHGRATAGDRFLLLHRRRVWTESERQWMGWERKRGKLCELNKLLRGAADTTFIDVDGRPPSAPDGVRYVITLDADTRLTPDAIRRLIGKMAHPLNAPRYDPAAGRVVEGYGILQPRVTPSMPIGRQATPFLRVFSNMNGIDPYAAAASDVYQDLLGEGSYTGKGIYDVDAFELALAGRAPPSALLSHDLFEGVFARSGLVSDVEFVEEFPSRYDSAALRHHRWARGDWQLLPWIFGFARRPTSGGVRGGVPVIGRWKMVDNLRRTISAPAAALAILAGLALPFQAALAWAGFVLGALAVTPLLPVVARGLAPPGQNMLLRHHVSALASEFRLALTQWLLAIALLAHQAWLMGDAVLRTLIRLVSRRNLLEWTPAAQASFGSGPPSLASYYRYMAGALVFGGAALVIAALGGGDAVTLGLAFALLWGASPAIALRASKPGVRAGERPLSHDDAIRLRLVARRTWRYFETFVTAENSMLPPDNYQDAPSPALAYRTSPTNIGLYLLSIASAREFGWISVEQAVQRFADTLSTLDKLERCHGHFFNWYDTRDLRALEPHYVSSVDSGNLAGHLITVANFCRDWSGAASPDRRLLKGVVDALALAREEARAIRKARRSPALAGPQIEDQIDEIETRVRAAVADTSADGLADLMRLSEAFADTVRAHAQDDGEANSDLVYWAQAASSALKACAHEIASPLGPELRHRLAELAHAFRELALSMDFRFLLDGERLLLSIGYRGDDGVLDPNCYDLLASEARLASFIAVAKKDAPTKHWFRLGHAVTPLTNGAALISWSGSMFEYLMPSLIMREPNHSLLERTNRLIVQRHIEYGRRLKAPWGISESAYNARDLELTYQYSSFGVPGLGLKRGLGEDVVVSPYATALAAMIDPGAAARNFEHLTTFGACGRYGFYEAIDFTPERLPTGRSFEIVRTFMAHHQGMTIAAIANVLLDGVVRARFHAEPMVRAAELLLQERVPRDVQEPPPLPSPETIVRRRHETEPLVPARKLSPWSAAPGAHLLSNGRYTVMLTAAGSGYSMWRGVAITRWREDATCDDWGSYIYLRDVLTGAFWSPSLQPVCEPRHAYDTAFDEDRAEFTCRAHGLTTTLEILVSAEDDAEVRRVSIGNPGPETREVEITSFVELALAQPASDMAHPAFSKLFVETEHLPHLGALLARRRRRAPEDAEIWAGHFAVAEGNLVGKGEFETDRAKFVGRGRDAHAPIMISSGSLLSGATGATLDPVFALRRRMRIAPGETARVHFWTIAAASRTEAEGLIDKHDDVAAFDRALALSWTQAQVQLHHIGVDRSAAALYQELAAHLIYATPALRPSSEVIRRGAGSQSDLWSLGISGDLPLMLVRLSEAQELGIVREALQAFEYLRLKRQPVDLVILNERAASYLQDLQIELENLVRVSQSRPHIGADPPPGHIYVLRADLVPDDARTLLASVARVVLHGDRGRLADQLTRRPYPAPAGTPVVRPSSAVSELQAPRIAPELEYFNGLGGFADNGAEYVTILDPSNVTPAPWINVIANPQFGFQVSESGAGYAWSVSSRERQITPWSNDPVTDRTGQVFYICDLDGRDMWTPTAEPMRDEAATYVARHGKGYSRFEHESRGVRLDLLEYAPIADPVKISRLTIINKSPRTRRLSVTGYVEWSLGRSRMTAAPFVATELDETSGAILAFNRWDAAFKDRVAFADFCGRQQSWTADRREFIGRNGATSNPVALAKRRPLSGRVGAGLDPCAALQTTIELAPGQSTELAFFLGDAESAAEARALIARYRAADLDGVLKTIREHWRGILGAVQVKTPDRSMDIMMNGWLLYQALACRIWARAAFYQASGAYGFRDQLQDVMAFAAIKPRLARAHLAQAAARQFVEGDVQHWWLPHTDQGVRTRISDDRVWLPFAVAHYVRVTGDVEALEEKIPFLQGQRLGENEHEAFFRPVHSDTAGSLYEHCARALDASLAKGGHGAPLIGGGDWNDAMNRVGAGGRGESVWLGWFLCATLKAFSPIADARNDSARAARWRAHAEDLRASLEEEAWDGEWYRRGWYDDGTPIGSSASEECRIDSIAQSWAVLSGVGDPERSRRAMAAVERDLILRHDGVALLFTPPFDRTPHEPGYIKGYPPGIRENGGQYTHGALWSVMALAALGEGDKAAALFWMLNPINHARTRSDAHRYKVEPYAVAADVYAAPPHTGRGGWTWYTGSAGLMHRVGLESILGLRFDGACFALDPCIPKSWPRFELTLRLGPAQYDILVQNPKNVSSGVAGARLDGVEVAERPLRIPLQNDGLLHRLEIHLS